MKENKHYLENKRSNCAHCYCQTSYRATAVIFDEYGSHLFVFWIHWVNTSAGGTLVHEGIHQLSCQTRLTWNLSNNVLQKFAAFDKILKHWKYEKALKNIALSMDSLPSNLASHFELFGFECFFCYIWIFDFLCFGSNTTDERLLLEMYI